MAESSTTESFLTDPEQSGNVSKDLVKVLKISLSPTETRRYCDLDMIPESHERDILNLSLWVVEKVSSSQSPHELTVKTMNIVSAMLTLDILDLNDLVAGGYGRGWTDGGGD